MAHKVPQDNVSKNRLKIIQNFDLNRSVTLAIFPIKILNTRVSPWLWIYYSELFTFSQDKLLGPFCGLCKNFIHNALFLKIHMCQVYVKIRFVFSKIC